jgi:hypothetical protein
MSWHRSRLAPFGHGVSIGGFISLVRLQLQTNDISLAEPTPKTTHTRYRAPTGGIALSGEDLHLSRFRVRLGGSPPNIHDIDECTQIHYSVRLYPPDAVFGDKECSPAWMRRRIGRTTLLKCMAECVAGILNRGRLQLFNAQRSVDHPILESCER